MTNQGKKTYTINPGESQTIPAGYHNGQGSVTANANQNSGTYTFASGSTGATVDMGVNNTYRYVNATNVYTKGKSDGAGSKGSFTVADGGTTGNTITLGYKPTQIFTLAIRDAYPLYIIAALIPARSTTKFSAWYIHVPMKTSASETDITLGTKGSVVSVKLTVNNTGFVYNMYNGDFVSVACTCYWQASA